MSDSLRPHGWQPARLSRPWDSPDKNTGVGCHFLLQSMKVKSESEVSQSCPTLREPMDCSLPGSSLHGIFQARVLEWGAILLTLDLSISGRNRFFFSPAVFKAFFFLCFSLGDSAYTQCKNSGLRRAFANTSEIKEFMKGP